ncbi:hypothetical protein ACQUEF_13500 [Vagococcus fluvialis]|uniref:hypothetical protein n=1 Tax=Vagococcus fluvialis TaxID=2738 RepID=UPI003D0A6C61
MKLKYALLDLDFRFDKDNEGNIREATGDSSYRTVNDEYRVEKNEAKIEPLIQRSLKYLSMSETFYKLINKQSITINSQNNLDIRINSIDVYLAFLVLNNVYTFTTSVPRGDEKNTREFKDFSIHEIYNDVFKKLKNKTEINLEGIRKYEKIKTVLLEEKEDIRKLENFNIVLNLVLEKAIVIINRIVENKKIDTDFFIKISEDEEIEFIKWLGKEIKNIEIAKETMIEIIYEITHPNMAVSLSFEIDNLKKEIDNQLNKMEQIPDAGPKLIKDIKKFRKISLDLKKASKSIEKEIREEDELKGILDKMDEVEESYTNLKKDILEKLNKYKQAAD